MTYQTFKQQLKNKEYQPSYYKLIVLYRTEILEDCNINGQKTVAPQLGMSEAKLSNILHILRVI